MRRVSRWSNKTSFIWSHQPYAPQIGLTTWTIENWTLVRSKFEVGRNRLQDAAGTQNHSSHHHFLLANDLDTQESNLHEDQEGPSFIASPPGFDQISGYIPDPRTCVRSSPGHQRTGASSVWPKTHLWPIRWLQVRTHVNTLRLAITDFDWISDPSRLWMMTAVSS